MEMQFLPGLIEFGIRFDFSLVGGHDHFIIAATTSQ
jgi:hypothetical protein